MRTPNCECIICKKQLYRRPFELKQIDYVCCRGCRSEAMKLYPNINVLSNLELGREKGTNHLEGIPKSQSQKDKMKKIMTDWCKNNVEKVSNAGLKRRGDNHYNWKGGISNLNKAIRLLNENRKWSDSVKQRDEFKCVECNSTIDIEAHHLIEFSEIILQENIKTINDARDCYRFWEINNGKTLCKKCHYKEHGRKYNGD